ncbi:DUF4395 domain-containing protein [Paenibacillus chungangensis]|uniref:DUF4395 domain-containing protein n=1 Tax=Paenibacillus chungangensis TaxID=696535 RepID=A0ABW3HT90_9BACL
MNNKPVLSYECLDEVPMHRVRANQTGILLCVIATFLSQQFWILLLPLVVQMISRTFGIRYNLFVRLISPLLPASHKSESRELLRFNSLLAILFLSISIGAYVLNLTLMANISLGLLAVAVILALSGFCFGCFMYFHWKQYWARRKISS